MEKRQINSSCILCDVKLKNFVTEISDYEYGVVHTSKLVLCPQCGLVTHSPVLTPTEIPSLYPDNYLAHTTASKAKGVYGYLKSVLANGTVKKCSKKIPSNGVFLEVGCGNGALLTKLSELRGDASFIGVDIKNVLKEELSSFEFFHGQLEDQDIPVGSVDVIYCSNLIEHVADPRLFLRKCKKILKPGGCIIGVTPDHLSVDRYMFGKYWAGYHYPRHTYVFNHNNIKIMLKKEGFKNVDVKGGYSFWYLSFANIFVKLHGLKKRGVMFAFVTAAFFPIDIVINIFRPHGSMTFIGYVD